MQEGLQIRMYQLFKLEIKFISTVFTVKVFRKSNF